MSTNPLVVERTDTTSPLAGTLLLEDGEQLVHAVQNGDWVSGGLALFTGALDTVAAVSDPLGTLFAMGIGWVIDHVEPLNSWLEDLTGDGDQVRAFAGTWANVSTHLQQQADELTRIVAADLAGMDGATITAYRQLAADMAEHMGGASRWAGSMSTALEVAATLVQIVHDIVRDAIAQVLGAVASYAAELIFTAGLATPLVIEQAATRAAALAARIGKYVTRLLTSFRNLDELLSGLRRLFDDLGRVFDDLFRGGRGPDAPRTPEAPRGDGGTPPGGPTGPGRTAPGADPGTPTGPSVPDGPTVSTGPDVPKGPGAGTVPGGGGAPGGAPVRPGPDADGMLTPDSDLTGGRPGTHDPSGPGTKPDPTTPDPTKPDPTKPDPTTPDPTKPDPNAPDPNAPDPNAPDPNAPDPTKPDPNAPDPNAPDPNAPDPNAPDPNAPKPAPSPLPDISDLDSIHPKHGNDVMPWAEAVAARHPTLSADEVAAIYRYTTNPGYTEMNGFLRDPSSVSPADAVRIQADVDAAVAGMSKLDPAPGTTLRGTDLPPSVLAGYTPGATVSDPAFWSTTTNPTIAEEFRAGGNAIIHLTQRNGIDVQALSHFGREAEILVPPGTQFTVISRTWNPGGFWDLVIEQVP